MLLTREIVSVEGPCFRDVLEVHLDVLQSPFLPTHLPDSVSKRRNSLGSWLLDGAMPGAAP